MAVKAMGSPLKPLPGPFRGNAAPDVLLPAYRLQMTGVDAGPVPAQVVQFFAGWQFSNEQKVSRTVRLPNLPVHSEVPVSKFVNTCCPLPATRRSHANLSQQPRFR